MELFLYILGFSLLGGVVSFAAALLLVRNRAKQPHHTAHLINFAAGALIAAAFLDLLPESIEVIGEAHDATIWAMIGFIIFFLIEGLFHWYHPTHQEERTSDCSDGGHHQLTHTPWLLITADTIHNFVDGVAIAAAFLINIPLGIVTTFAIAAHEIPQEVGDVSVMLHAGWKKSRVIFWNLVSAFAATAGAVATYLVRDYIDIHLGTLLALTAGFFIYIGASDLVPELYRTTKRDRLSHAVIMFFVGIIVVSLLAELAHSLGEH